MSDSSHKEIKQNPNNPYVTALLATQAGDWGLAHRLVQDLGTKEAAQIHAYLHRVEGDLWNADYWYAKVQVKRPSASSDSEWQLLMQMFA